MMKRINYDQISGVYDQRYQAGGPAGIAECLRELAHQTEGRRVLEVGCGTGHWLTLLPNVGIRCGLDYSAGMLDKARQRDDSLRLVRGTADRLPFCQGVFDLVFCVHALHHFDDPATFIRQARRVIRAGGALAIVGMDPQREPDQWYLYDYFPGTRETDRGRYPSGDMILHWMETAGFVRCERRLAARIEHDFIGSKVLNDPILQKNGTSQLALLTEEDFRNGMARIREALRLAESSGEKIVFQTRIALPIVIGFVPDTRESCPTAVLGVARCVGREADQMSGAYHMRTVRLGKTGLEVSRVGMGGIPLTRPSEEDAIRVVQRALDLGINFIDTAIGYGISEERIGKAIAGRRDQVILATKGGAAQHIEWSLQRLRTDHIDLWQFHGINSFERLAEVLQPGGALEDVQQARRAGKIRHIGFSSHSLRVALEAVSSGRFETVQFPLNFISAEAAEELVPLAHTHDVGFIAMKPFAGGRIRDANLAVKYLLQFDNVVPDPGIERVKEIEEIVDIVNSGQWKLTVPERQVIEEIRARVGTRFCRQCEYCMPCPQGVHIHGVMYLPILWELWPPDWFFSWGYVKNAVESARNCLQCGECEEKCPYHLPIREMIVENIAFYERVAEEYHSPSSPARQ